MLTHVSLATLSQSIRQSLRNQISSGDNTNNLVVVVDNDQKTKAQRPKESIRSLEITKQQKKYKNSQCHSTAVHTHETMHTCIDAVSFTV